MSKMKCIIIDDEPLARKVIREYISEIDFLELAAEAESIDEIRPALADTDLIFLDVQMPGTNGIEFLYRERPSCIIILTTAFPQYALQGYELDVLDYLVKPISAERFTKAVHKAQELHKMRTLAEEQPSTDSIFIKCDRKIESIAIKDISHIEAMANYVVVHTKQKKYITYMTLKRMNELLPLNFFVQIHKSYLAALHAIKRIEGNTLHLEQTSLPISKHYKTGAMDIIRRQLVRR